MIAVDHIRVVQAEEEKALHVGRPRAGEGLDDIGGSLLGGCLVVGGIADLLIPDGDAGLGQPQGMWADALIDLALHFGCQIVIVVGVAVEMQGHHIEVAVVLKRGGIGRQQVIQHDLVETLVAPVGGAAEEHRRRRIGGLDGLVADFEELSVLCLVAGPKIGAIRLVPQFPDMYIILELGDHAVDVLAPVIFGIIPG